MAAVIEELVHAMVAMELKFSHPAECITVSFAQFRHFESASTNPVLETENSAFKAAVLPRIGNPVFLPRLF